MRRRLAPALGLRTAALLLTLGAFGVMALILLWAGHASTAFASSEGSVTMDPSSGPVGTSVQIGISLSLDTPQPYILAATATDPAQGGCASAQPFPGLDPVSVGQQGGHAQLTWPPAFGSGQYWLCASPQNGAGPSAHSFQPFVVAATGSATATATPVHGGERSVVSAAVTAPADGAPAGSTVTVIVTGWTTPDNAPPTAVKLVPSTDANAATEILFVVAASPAPGDFNLKVTLPVTTAPGQYAFEVDGAYQVRTTFVDVVPATTPTATVNAATSPGPTQGGGGAPALAIGATVAALLVLAGAILVASALGRKRAAVAQRQHADAYGPRRHREEEWRR
jgi:hypothetical protein